MRCSGGVVSIVEIAEVMGITTRAVNKRAKKEGWKAEVLNRRGDKRFPVEGLPADIRVRVIQARESVYIKGVVLPSRADLDLGQAKALLEQFDSAPAWSRRKAEVRGEIVEAFIRFADGGEPSFAEASAGKGLTKAKEIFVNRYNARNPHLGISEEAFELYETISRPSLDAWRSKKKELGLAGLLESVVRGKPPGRITPEMADYMIGIKRQKIHTRPVRIHEYLVNKFAGPGIVLPHEATVRRFISNWEKEKAELVSFLRNPDKWRSDYQAAFGDASEKAEYFLHMMEFDNTPADVMCADGQRYTVTGAIDIFSRKARCLLVPTSKSVAIANMMRRLILDWGIFDVGIMDNGKDYASKHIDAVCGALGIEQVFTPPFTPENKPHIERFFRSLSMMLFEELSGYIGHSVADRKDIESRKSFAQRMFGKGNVIECRMTAEELQAVIDTWVDKIYHQRTHSTLGKSPEARAGESGRTVKKILDERVLDILLAPVGRPTVSKKGIRYQNGRYVAPELADGHIKGKVQIRRDMADAGRLYVFDMESRFICIATDAALEGLTVEEVNIARKRQVKRIREQAAALKSLAKEVGDPMMDLLESKRNEKGQVFAFSREEAFENEAVREAMKAVDPASSDQYSDFAVARDEFEADPPSPEGYGAARKIVKLHKEEPFFVGFGASIERYRYLQQQMKIRTLTEKEAGWIEGYQGTEEYYQVFVMPYE